MNAGVILEQMLMLGFMMLIGYVIWKIKWFDDHAYQQLSRIVVNILNPFLVLSGVLDEDMGDSINLLLQNLAMTLFFYFLLIAFSWVVLVIVRPKKENQSMFRLMSIFPNVGFMAIPVITGIFGKQCMIYIIFYILAYNLLLYSYGVAVVKKPSKNGEKQENSESIKNFWKNLINPGIIASVVALIIFLLQLHLPDTVVTCVGYLGNAVIPLSMIMIGMSIAQADLKVIFSNQKIYLFTFIRMILLPIIVLLLLKQIPGIHTTILSIFALQLAMPVGSIVTLLAKENGMDDTISTSGIVLTTLMSILTIPLVGLFL